VAQARPVEVDAGDTSAPAYRRVKDHVLSHILAGDWEVGERIPSEHELKAQFGVSRMTVHRAIRELTEEGYVSRTVGAGTFVADRRVSGSAIPIRDIADEARAAGRQVRVRVVARSRNRAGVEAAARLGVAPGDLLYCATLVRWIGNTPLQLEERWVSAALAPAFETFDLERDSADDQLLRLLPKTRATYEVAAVVPKGKVRTLLALSPDEACLQLSSVLTVGDDILSIADLYMPGSRYALPGRFL
jgi:GntR family transcriptional regulator, histidine utilization repressor